MAAGPDHIGRCRSWLSVALTAARRAVRQSSKGADGVVGDWAAHEQVGHRPDDRPIAFKLAVPRLFAVDEGDALAFGVLTQLVTPGTGSTACLHAALHQIWLSR